MVAHREVKAGRKAHRRRGISDHIKLQLHLNHDTILRNGLVPQYQREIASGLAAQLNVDLERSVKTFQCETQPTAVPVSVVMACKVEGCRLRVPARVTVQSDRDIAFDSRGYQASADRWVSVLFISKGVWQ